MYFLLKTFPLLCGLAGVLLFILSCAKATSTDSAATDSGDEAKPADGSSLLMWYNISDAVSRGALCNDFTVAGYFIRKNLLHQDTQQQQQEKVLEEGETGDSSGLGSEPKIENENQGEKWVIFLEGGGGCTLPESCNQRYIDQEIRNQFRVFGDDDGTETVNVASAWNEYRNQPLTVTSKLMTSLYQFAGSEREGLSTLVTGGDDENSTLTLATEGRDLLSTSPSQNPDFYQHNHVLVPYCSSDLWLKNTHNYKKALDANFSFQFDPLSVTEHQFTFRGVAIFRSVVQDLVRYHGFAAAKEVILAGSSAGGIGAMHHAKWLQELMKAQADGTSNSTTADSSGRDARLYVLMDSAWFIDFKGGISSQFAPDDLRDLVSTGELSHTCLPTSTEGDVKTMMPLLEAGMCVSAPLFLSSGEVFPPDVPLLVIFSQYDLYLLGQALATIVSVVAELASYLIISPDHLVGTFNSARAKKENDWQKLLL